MIIRSITQAATIVGTPPVNQDFLNASGPGSPLTPVAALYELGGVTTVGTPATNGDRYGIGATDGTTQRSMAFLVEDAGSNQDTGNRFDTDTVFQLSLTGVETSRDGEANWDSWQTGGSRVAWSDLLATALQCKATHFYSCQAKVVEFAGNATINLTAAVAGLGFAPDMAIAFSHYAAFSADGTNTNGRIARGYAVKGLDGVIQQVALTKYSKDNPGLSMINAGVIRDDCFIAKIDDTADGARLSLTSWDSDGATITTLGVSESVSCAILFLKTDRPLWAGIPSLVTSSTGVKSITDPGFPVEAYFTLASAMTAKNSRKTDNSTDGWFFGSYTGNDESGLGGCDPDASAPDTRSINESKIVRVMKTPATGADDWVAVHSSLDTTGFSINVTTASAADRLAAFVAIGFVLISNETERISDQATLLQSWKKVVDETERISDQANFLQSWKLPTSETERISDQALLLQTWKRVIDETERISDQAVLLLRNMLVAAETERISDQALLFIGKILSTSEVETISDGFILTLMTPGAVIGNETEQVVDEALLFLGNFIKTTETEQILDGHVLVPRTAIFSTSETERISDAAILILGRVLVANETVQISDAMNTGRGLIARKATYRGRVF